MTKDQEIVALKAQVNALREVVYNVLFGDKCAECIIYYRFENPLNETPEQCLADYRNQVIDECINYDLTADTEWCYAIQHLEDLKND